jgi:hypothetical protein
MSDLFGILATLLCFAAAIAYIKGCDVLKVRPRHD